MCFATLALTEHSVLVERLRIDKDKLNISLLKLEVFFYNGSNVFGMVKVFEITWYDRVNLLGPEPVFFLIVCIVTVVFRFNNMNVYFVFQS